MNKLSLHKRAALMIAWLSIAGCSAINKSKMTSFEPYTENGQKMFRFKSERNESVYPNDESGEAVRTTWINEYVSDNQYCINGFSILSREFVKGGDVYGLRESYYYVGKCK